MKKVIYKWIFFRLMGWKIVGTIDPKVKKCVMMVIPHTSWHDFYLGIFTKGITGLDMNRKKVEELKTGFYYIALKANVPIIPVAFDFGKKEVNLGLPLSPTGNIQNDLKILKSHFIGVKGKKPELGFIV